MLVSYAQNFEDVMLWRALGQVKAGFPNGFYIDIGAHDPVVDSVSLAFYEHGWRGIHVEPTARYAEMLRQHRPDEKVIQAAVGTTRSPCVFFEIPDTGLSTSDRKIAQQHRSAGFVANEISVPSTTLAAIFDSCAGREIHWMKIDVEGAEHDVLKSWHESKARPWIVVVESTLPLTQTESFRKWEPLLLRRGYAPVYWDGLNRYYVSSVHSELKSAFRAAPNLFDQFALSGTSSAPFCSLLAEKFRAALKQKDLELEGGLAREQALRAADQSLREQADRLQSAWDLEKVATAELKDQLLASQRETLRIAQESGIREQELGAKVVQAQAEIARLAGTIAARETELGVQLEASRTEYRRAADDLAARYREIDAQRQKEIDRLNAAMAAQETELGVQLEASRREARRAAEELAARHRDIDVQRRRVIDQLRRAIQDEAADATDLLSNVREPVFDASPADAYRLRDLTRFHDQAFVDAAYRALLGRAPDSAGSPFYLNRLRSGISKERILGEIRYSKEGELANTKVSGLAVAYALERAAALPIAGAGVRLLLSLWRQPDLVRERDFLAGRIALLASRLRSSLERCTAAMQGTAPGLAAEPASCSPDASQDMSESNAGRPSILSSSIDLSGKSPDDAFRELAALLSLSREARDLASR